MLVRGLEGDENGLPRDGDVTAFGRLDDASDGWVGKEVGIVGENPSAMGPISTSAPPGAWKNFSIRSWLPMPANLSLKWYGTYGEGPLGA